MENRRYSCMADCTAQPPSPVVVVVVGYSMAFGGVLYLRPVVLVSVGMYLGYCFLFQSLKSGYTVARRLKMN